MLGEKADRRSAAPISSAIEWKRFLNISSSAGSIRIVSQHQIQMGVHSARKARRNNRCGTVFHDHCRPEKLRTRSETLASIKRGPPKAISKPDILFFDESVVNASATAGRALWRQI